MRVQRVRRGGGTGTGRALALCAAALLLGACAPAQDGVQGQASGAPGAVAAAGAGQDVEVQGLRFRVPQGWSSQQPQSSMRLAEYTAPGAAGDASLVLFRFAGGGTAQANVDRWVSQFQAPGGGSAASSAQVRSEQRGGLTLTALDVRGRYEGQQMPGAPAQPALDDARLLALVVEGSQSPYFFKLQGPAATVAQWESAWSELVASVSLP